MSKYEIYKTKSREELEEIINNPNLPESDIIVASIIIAESDEEYDLEETINEILNNNKNECSCSKRFKRNL